MRPMSLSVSGLHSFREKQVVDFDALCEGGVFGIFGPTGSGKSSLLDAMTLALYGKVERATNNTQGIMNHAENELVVSFIFELGNADGVRRYQVDRSFKRNDELRLKTSTCRLLEITDKSYVIADKMNEVNNEVQNLLGLTIEDFTRAVVLPQGKFAEFLSLKGSDRRKMLQRLFNLEKYGDDLNDKIRSKVQVNTAALEQVVATQSGLGDASKEVLEQVEQKFKDAEQGLAEKDKEFVKLEKQYEEKKQIWQWQQEKMELEKRNDALHEKKEEIEAVDVKLQRAEAADKLKPYLDDYVEVSSAKEQAQMALEKKNSELENVQKDHDQAQKKFEQYKEERAQNESPLIIKIEQLNQAKKLENEVNGLQMELNQVKQKMENNIQDLQDKKQQLEKATHLKNKAIHRQQELKDELKKVTVTVNERETLRQASELKKEIIALEKKQRELSEEANEKQKALDAKTKNLEDVTQKYEHSADKLLTLFNQTEKLYHYVSQREQETNKLFYLNQDFIDDEKKRLEQEKTKELAEKLTNQLIKGEPCPVCGSKEHPNSSIEHSGNQVEAMEKDLEALEENRHVLTRLQQEATHFKFVLEQLSSSISNVLPNKIQEIRNEKVLEDEAIVESEKVKESIEALCHYSEDMLTELKALKQDILHVSDNIKNETSMLQSYERERNELLYVVKVEDEAMKQLKVKIEEASEDLQICNKKWQNTFIDCNYEMIEQEQKEVLNKDKRATEIQEGLEKSEPFLDENEKKITQLQEAINQVQVDYAKQKASYDQMEKSILQKQDLIKADVGDNNIDHLLKVAQTKLDTLKKNESESYQELQELVKTLQTYENNYAAAVQSLKDTETRYEKVKQKWFEVLEESNFTEASEVNAAYTPIEEQKEMKAEIDRYFDGIKQIMNELKKIESQLQGKEITEQDWHEVQSKLTDLKTQLNVAREEKGAAFEMLQEVKKKHQRFNELEKERKKLEKEAEKLSKLQQVFRGNAFVEYIAEEQLLQVSRDASERLGHLTIGRYAIEVDSNGGFVMRDDANGGVRRPVTTLSGGETFLTSLALALSLSAQIQLRGEYPLEFFFLDEGFGTLDQELLDTVVTSLEKLHTNRLSVGVISHVQELRARLPRKLVVEPAEPSGRGSKVHLEVL